MRLWFMAGSVTYSTLVSTTGSHPSIEHSVTWSLVFPILDPHPSGERSVTYPLLIRTPGPHSPVERGSLMHRRRVLRVPRFCVCSCRPPILAVHPRLESSRPSFAIPIAQPFIHIIIRLPTLPLMKLAHSLLHSGLLSDDPRNRAQVEILCRS